jgi:hypothetical protein
MQTIEFEGEQWVQVDDVAAVKNVTRSAVHEAVKAGRLRGRLIYGRKFVLLADAEGFQKNYGGPRPRAGRPRKPTT